MYPNATDIVKEWAAGAQERKEKFTPGPWFLKYTERAVFAENDNRIGYASNVGKTAGEAAANAALIAAAPELYEAGNAAKEQMHIGLSAIQKLIEYHPENKALKRMEAEMKQAIGQIGDALSKARGEQ